MVDTEDVVAVKFLILGPLEVRRGAQAISIRSGRHRALLALLVLQANSIVPVDRLIDDLWEGAPPDGAANTLQAYVSQLRRLLEPGRIPAAASDILVTRSPGYALIVADGAIDAHGFQHLAQQGRQELSRGNARAAAHDLKEALSLWRGPALVDFMERWAEPERRHLEELRLTTFEDWIDAELALGRASAIVDDLSAAVQREPLRERLRAQLMIALYRSGRQADALATYREARRVLVKQLGIEPSPKLRELHASILAQAATLTLTPAIDVPVHRAPAGEKPREAASGGHWRERIARRARAWRRVHLGAIAVVLIAGAIVAAARRHTNPSMSGTRVVASSVVAIDPATNRVVAEVALPTPPTAVAVTPDAVWAASAQGQTLTRIDASTMQVQTALRLHATPTGVSGGADGSVWVAEGLLHRLVAVRAQQGGTLVVEPVPLPGCCRGPSVVTASHNVVYTADAGGLHRIDGSAASAVKVFTPHVGSAGMVHDVDGVWVSDGWATMTHVFAYTSRITRRIEVSSHGRPGEPTAMAAGGGQIWAVATGLDEAVLLDRSGTGIAARVPVGHRPAAIAYGRGSIWVANTAAGTVSRIDPETKTVVATINVGHRVSSLAYGSGRLWVGVEPLGAADREHGVIAFDDRGQIYVERADGSGRRQLTHGAGVTNVEPMWSPDGTQILFDSNRRPSRANYHFDLYVMNADGTGQVRLTHDLHSVTTSGVWSPDGSEIAFFRGHVNRDGWGAGDVYVMHSDGTHIRRLTNTREGTNFAHSWTPDGRKLIITSTTYQPGGPGRMYIMNADGSHVRRVLRSRGDDDNPVWSRDGVHIVYSGQDDGPGLYLTTAKSGEIVELSASTEAGGHILPAWSPDGTAIAFAGTFEVPSDLFLVNSDGSGLMRLTSDGEVGSPSWRPTP